MQKKIQKLRFGILTDTATFKSWEVDCIQQVLNLGNIELVLFIQPIKDNHTSHKGSFSQTLFNNYTKLLFKPKCNKLTALPSQYLDIPTMSYPIRNGKHPIPASSDEKEFEKIKAANLDFILSFLSRKDLTGKILGSAKYGIWSFFHDDPEKYNTNTPCFWEIYGRDNVSAAILYKMSAHPDSFSILRAGYYNTIHHSYKNNYHNIHIQSAVLVKEVCADLLENNTDYIDIPPKKVTGTELGIPDNWKFLKFFTSIFFRKLKKIYRILFISEQWNIGLFPGPLSEFLKNDLTKEIDWLLPSTRKEFFSDPFIIEWNDSTYILFEHFKTKNKRGNISVIALDTKRDIKSALSKSHHLSYPFLFKQNGDIYMIPEQWEATEVALYKAINFPIDWEKISVLIPDMPATDATLFKNQDLWWMTFTRKDKNPDLRLYIYFATDLFGPWIPHKKNPVKTDIRSSRPAGSVFTLDDNFIRPSQDCSQSYGGRIVLNKIKKLTPHAFEEEEYQIIDTKKLKPFTKGIHTINASDALTIIDGKKYIWTLRKIRRLVQSKFKQIFPPKKPKFRLINMPIFVKKAEYHDAVQRCVESLKKQEGIISIYQVGSVNHPGISDLDIIAVFEEETPIHYNPRTYLTGVDTYLFTHNLTGITRSQFVQIHKYSCFHNYNHLWGEKIELDGNILDPQQFQIIKIQIALEFLVKNYIDLTIQLEYKILNVRSLLQHIKGIRYDLEFLSITSGKMHDMVNQLIGWMDQWFQNPITPQELYNWIQAFYQENKTILDKYLIEHTLYIPEWGNLKYTRNIQLKHSHKLGYHFSGFSMPLSLLGINKRTFNLNTRFNSFEFQIPFNHTPHEDIVRERYIFYKQLKEYAAKYYPNFSPLTTSFSNKIA